LRYHFENYVLDTDKRELRRGGGDPVSIAPQVFDVLEYLILNRERVVSKDDLIDAIWKGRIVSDTAVTTRLNAARTAIGDSGEEQRLIKTLPRKGFVLSARCERNRGLPPRWRRGHRLNQRGQHSPCRTPRQLPFCPSLT
jgi:DNA-binding winged helix-turn-helix (wHTH) protein